MYNSDKAVMGTVVNQAFPSLHGGSLDITHAVSLKSVAACSSFNFT